MTHCAGASQMTRCRPHRDLPRQSARSWLLLEFRYHAGHALRALLALVATWCRGDTR